MAPLFTDLVYQNWRFFKKLWKLLKLNSWNPSRLVWYCEECTTWVIKHSSDSVFLKRFYVWLIFFVHIASQQTPHQRNPKKSYCVVLVFLWMLAKVSGKYFCIFVSFSFGIFFFFLIILPLTQSVLLTNNTLPYHNHMCTHIMLNLLGYSYSTNFHFVYFKPQKTHWRSLFVFSAKVQTNADKIKVQ